MSELSVKVAAEHTFFPITGCLCREWRGSERGHAAHLAEVTEAAVRETIAARCDALSAIAGSIDRRNAYRDTARIARGES